MKLLYIDIETMIALKNIFLTSSLSFILGFYSLCNIFIYFKRIEHIQYRNRQSFFELNNTFETIEIKYNKLQYEVVCLKDELNEIKLLVNKLEKYHDTFISPVSSLETLDFSVNEDVICDELCNSQEKYDIPSKITSTPIIEMEPLLFYNPSIVDDSHIDFSYEEQNLHNENNSSILINNDNDKSNSKSNNSEFTSSVDSINHLKSILGYQLVYEEDFTNKCIQRTTSLSNEDVEVNRIIPEERTIISTRVKRSQSVSDVNWVGLTKRFIFG